MASNTITHTMNKREAISRARLFLEERKHGLVHWDRARAVFLTKEALLAGLQTEDFPRKAELEAFTIPEAEATGVLNFRL